MPRPPKGWWDERSKRYYCRLGEVNPETGKRSNMRLDDEDGRPIPWGETGAVAAAIRRRLAEIAERERRSRGPTVADVCQMFLDWHRANGSAPRTIRDHLDHLDAFATFEHGGIPYGDRPAASITLADLSRMRRAMEAAGNQSGYIRIRYASILACWRWASRPIEDREPERLLASNPFDGVTRPRRGTGRNKALPWDVSRRVIRLGWARAARHKYHRPDDRAREKLRLLSVRYCALTGCRPDEAARLRWDELDLAQRVAVQRGKTTSRTGKPRRTPLTTSLAKALARIARWDGRHPEYVFLTGQTRKLKPPTSRECGRWFRALRQYLVAGPMPDLPKTASLYWLRHAWQTDGLEIASAEGVAAAAGNSPGVLLSVYDHTRNKRIVEVGDAIERRRRESRGAN